MSAMIPSPRTHDEPMGFTRDEFWRGAMRAWGAFLVLLLVLEAVIVVVVVLNGPSGTRLTSLFALPVILGVSLLFGGVISAVSLLLGMPLAYRLATALRRENRTSVHLTCYARYGFGFGALIGGASYAVAFASSSVSVVQPALVAALIAGALSSVSVTCAWWMTARDALWADRGIPRRARARTRVDPDAVAEDLL